MDEHDEPRPVGRSTREARDHVLRRAVEEVDVLGDQRDAITDRDIDDIRHRGEQPLTTELLAEPVDLGRAVHFGPHGDRQQRQPARQLRGVRIDP